LSRLLCTCGKSYDVSGRAAGSRVRCRACQTVLTVPASRMLEGAARTASERLRAARGAPCPRHPKTLAIDPCENCHRWMCEACRAKAPSSHLCKDCAPAVGATAALPVDFGFLATIEIAVRLATRALPRLLALNIVANIAKWALALPFMIAVFLAMRQINPKDVETAELVLFFAIYALAGLIITLFEVVLIPAADIAVLDRTLREWRDTTDVAPQSAGESIRAAVRRAWERKGTLILTFLLLLAALIGSFLVLLPFILLYQLSENGEFIAAGLCFSMPAAGAVLGAFGLAIPVVVLEHRSAPQAFGRAWNLARLRPFAAAAFGTGFVVVGALLYYRLLQFQQAWGLIPALLVAFVGDIAWPAILVAAYHGLVAEEARLVGRRS
jgi:hypothetical protein